jgi:calcium/calmodulin-dependent protein kinase kinase 2
MEETKHSASTTRSVRFGQSTSGNKTLNQYTVLQTLGQGNYGKVKLCQTNDLYFAIKIYSKSLLRRRKDYSRCGSGRLTQCTALDSVYREIDLMKQLAHKNVLRLYEVMETDDKIYLVTDYCEKGPVLDWAPAQREFFCPWSQDVISSAQLRRIVRGMVSGLEYLHGKNIIHRDIKPQNVMINSEWVVKIGDLGQAQQCGQSDLQTATVGTYFFFPPECCCAETSHFSGKAADIWALGITVYALLYRKLPFWAESLTGIFEVILNTEISFPEASLLDPLLLDLLQKLLDKNPKTRIKMFELVQHSWLVNLKPETHNPVTLKMRAIVSAVMLI